MTLHFLLDPELTPELRADIVTLWVEVTNAGGAVGFVAPVTAEKVRTIADPTLAGIAEGPDRLLLGYDDDRLVAMAIFTDPRFHLKPHLRTLTRVMVHPDTQGRGVGEALMRTAAQIGRDLGLSALHVTVRDGLGLDRFYRRLGYREVGRWPGAIRVAPGDDRDEILMWLGLTEDHGPASQPATPGEGRVAVVRAAGPSVPSVTRTDAAGRRPSRTSDLSES